MESVSLSAEKGCPFCNFSVCIGHGCMFFAPINEDDYDCIILATFWFTASTYGNTALLRATNFEHHPHLSGLELRPEAVQKRVDATRQALEVLAALEKDVCMNAYTKAEIANTRVALSNYMKSLKSDVEIGDKLWKGGRQKKRE